MLDPPAEGWIKGTQNFEDWEASLLFSSKEGHEWHSQPTETKMQKFREYEADVYRPLSLGAYFTFRDHDTIKPLETSRAHRSDLEPKLIAALKSFDLDIASLSNLETFSHKVGYLDDDHWGLHWNSYTFDIDMLINRADGNLDQEIEALQLSYTLRALGWAREKLPRFRSLHFSVKGSGCWNLNRICCLWNDQEERGSDD